MSKGLFPQYFTDKKLSWMTFVAGGLTISLIGLVFLVSRDLGDENSFGIISDIHAGKEKKYVRDESNIVFPARYGECLGLEIKKFKKANASFAIALGDNTNKSDEDYANALKNIARREKFDIFWVKGNHERKSFEFFGPNFYAVDRDVWRIIVLDSVGDVRNGDGRLIKEQLDFLREKINTNKEVIIAMHHPIFKETNPEVILPQYQEFANIVRGKARYVLAGHWHRNFLKEIDGTKFIVQEALSGEKECYSKIIEGKK